MHAPIEVTYSTGATEQYSPGTFIEVGEVELVDDPVNLKYTKYAMPEEGQFPRIMYIEEPSGQIHAKHIETVREISAL